MYMPISIKKLRPDAQLPTYATAASAGADLHAVCEQDVTILPHCTVLVPTGLAVAIPQGYAGLIYARSGLSSKQDLAPANKVGVIDSDYRGEIMVALHNHGTVPRTVTNGERIAQLVIAPVWQAQWAEVDDLDDTARGTGGFGSTGQ